MRHEEVLSWKRKSCYQKERAEIFGGDIMRKDGLANITSTEQENVRGRWEETYQIRLVGQVQQSQRDVEKEQVLPKAKGRKMWRAMIAQIVKKYNRRTGNIVLVRIAYNIK